MIIILKLRNFCIGNPLLLICVKQYEHYFDDILYFILKHLQITGLLEPIALSDFITRVAML